MTTLADLLTQLEGAIHAGDRPRALDLARQIEQRLALEDYEHSTIERQVRALLAELDAPNRTVTVTQAFDSPSTLK